MTGPINQLYLNLTEEDLSPDTFPYQFRFPNSSLTDNGDSTLSVSFINGIGGPFTAGSVIFSDGTLLAEDNANLFWDDTNNRLGIGTNAPSEQLELTKSIELPTTTASDEGVIYKDGRRQFHDFHHPTGSTAIPAGKNTFLGDESGNFTTGSNATITAHGSYNIGIGNQSLKKIDNGYMNVAIGNRSMDANTDGIFNVGLGGDTLTTNTTGRNNMAMGFRSLRFNVDGDDNVGAGRSSLENSTKDDNVAIGSWGLAKITTGQENAAIGYRSGYYHADGSTLLTSTDRSVYIGAYAKGYNNNDDNTIVIGYNAIGLGANTSVIGNSSTTKHKVWGTLETDKGRIVNITRITSGPYTALATDHHIFVNTDAGAITLNLPAGVDGTNYRIINTGSSGNDITVAPNGSELLTGANASKTMSDGTVIILTYETTSGWW